MIRNYIKIAFRNILKKKFYAFLNLVGLVLGITSALFILIYIQDELSYDTFHPDAENMYVVKVDGKIGKQIFNGIFSPPPMAQGIADEISAVDKVTRTYPVPDDMVMRYKDASFTQRNIAWADSNFFDFFGYKLLQGDPETALKDPHKVVLTQSAATKYFGSGDPIGKTLIVGSNNESYKVTGIAADPPHNSHFGYEVLLSFQSNSISQSENWLSNSLNTYLKLNDRIEPEKIENHLNQLVEKNAGPLLKAYTGMDFSQLRQGGGKYGYTLLPVLDLHLHATDLDSTFKPLGDISYIYIFGVIGLVLILLACVNFMNLSTASSSSRAREVGIRKTMGSDRYSMVMQFLIESLIYVIIAVIISLQLVDLLLPWFNQLSGKTLTLHILSEWWFVASIIGLTVLIGLAAGSYPAFYLTSFDPAKVLKNNLFIGGESRLFRNSLVITQFFISIGLIMCTIVVYQQLDYMQNKNLGISRENTIIITNMTHLGNNREAFKERLLSETQIKAASYSPFNIPGDPNFSGFSRPGTDRTFLMGITYADYDFDDALDIKMKAGRFFDRDFPTDTAAYIINEAAAEELGLDDPIGENLILLDNSNEPFTIIGVMENFNYESLRRKVRPLVLGLNNYSNNLYVRFTYEDPREAIENIGTTWESFAEAEPFDYTFIDENFDALFRQEQRLGQVFAVFTFLAIIIACLGLLGLTAYTTEQRKREIGIRKVMGASVSSLLVLLNRDFLKLIGMAFLLAVPVSWYFMQQWLQDFAYRIQLSPDVVLITSLVTFLVVLLTVSWQSARAAMMKPVESIRSE